MIKKIYRVVFPMSLRLWLSKHFRQPVILRRYFLYDMGRFRKNFSGSKQIGMEHRLARITALYHVLEKGLSFRDSRPLFGQDNVKALVSELKVYLEVGGSVSATQWQSAVKVLDLYLTRHTGLQVGSTQKQFIEDLDRELLKLRPHLVEGDVGGGIIECHREDIQRKAKGDYPEMALSRYSVRHFTEEPVCPEVIEQAVAWAQKSPSVCNRQGSRIHAVKDRKLINEILEIHGGTRGFTEQINALLLVTGDLRIFFGATERNQVFLDTGIFSMSLLYGLHYQGVGACPLHWCVAPAKDLALRSLVKIPDEETITTLIAVGSLPKEFKVAHSQRRPLCDVLKWK